MRNMPKEHSRQAGFDLMTSDASRDTRWNLRLALFLMASGLLIYHALFFDFLNDDAFISFRYADNLARHGQLVFNLGERVEGYTNFLWTIMMAGVIWLGQDPGAWSRILGIGLAVGTLGVVMNFIAHTRGRPSSLDSIGAFLLAGAPAYACWSTGGLETQLFTFLVTLGLTGYLRARSGYPERLPLEWHLVCARSDDSTRGHADLRPCGPTPLPRNAGGRETVAAKPGRMGLGTDVLGPLRSLLCLALGLLWLALP